MSSIMLTTLLQIEQVLC